jgi:hypothetical protein
LPAPLLGKEGKIIFPSSLRRGGTEGDGVVKTSKLRFNPRRAITKSSIEHFLE